jgi:hypothetical protein
MATNPYFTQLHTQRFSFIGSPQQRDGTYLKDQRFLNMYPELIKSPVTDGKKYYLKKRPGLSNYILHPPGEGRAAFYWQITDTYYYVIGDTLYVNGTGIFTFPTSTGRVGFCEFRSDTVDELFMCDGVNGWTISQTNSIFHITDANFPNFHIPNPIFLDGYIFLATRGSQQIRNSTLQDPTTWPVDGFIDAEMYPDNLVALTKAQNYLVAVGTESVEFLYDNANPTGSPLQRNAPAVSQFGCPAPYTVNQTEKEVIMVGATGNGGRTVWMIDGFQPTEIAQEPVREALDAEGENIVNAFACTIQCAGHKWYILTLALQNRTFVFDFEEQMWHEWSLDLTQNGFLFPFCADSGNGLPFFLHEQNGQTALLGANNYTDLGNPINCVVTTSKVDFDTIMRKRFYRLSLITDAPDGDTSVPITVQWSDDDYNTWSSGTTLQLNGSYPTIIQLGYSRRRAFMFTYQQPYPLRMESFELDIIQEVRR